MFDTKGQNSDLMLRWGRKLPGGGPPKATAVHLRAVFEPGVCGVLPDPGPEMRP